MIHFVVEYRIPGLEDETRAGQSTKSIRQESSLPLSCTLHLQLNSASGF